MSKFKDETGNKYNMLTVVGLSHKTDKGKAYWKCLCDCGNETIVSGGNLRDGSVKSCGCLKYLPKDTHHLSNTKLYGVYRGMKTRCYTPSAFGYKYYGAKGIKICDEWNNSFESFYKWAMENGYEEGLTIDRLDNSKDYQPDNCRWTTREEQSNNRDFCVMITYKGKTQNLMCWCKELGLNYKRVHSRMFRLGWDFEKSAFTPIYRKEKETKENGL